MKTSIIMLAYNHEAYIREALASALAQSHPADEIIIIDDASADRTASIIESVLADNPEAPIRFVRNDRNIGVTGSFAKALSMAQGEVILGMAGDDVSAPHRVERSVAYLAEHPKAMAAISNADVIDDQSIPKGHLDNCAGATEPTALSLDNLRRGEYFLRGRSSCGAAAVYRMEIFRAFASLNQGLFAEDDPCAFRAMMLGTCDFLPERLVRWRRHGNNLSYGTGARRGPEMAVHYRKCEAMVDQMLEDAARQRLRGDASPVLEVAVTGLRFQKAKWLLWAASHRQGIAMAEFAKAFNLLRKQSLGWQVDLSVVWRPFFKMLTPYFLQRLLVRLFKP